jgi:hypothetical protein
MGSFDSQTAYSILNGSVPINTKPRNVAVVELQGLILVDVV